MAILTFVPAIPVAPGSSVTVTCPVGGSVKPNTDSRLRVDGNLSGAVFTSPASGTISKAITAPPGAFLRTVPVMLEQANKSGSWRMVADGGLVVSGPSAPPPPGDTTGPVISGVVAGSVTQVGAQVRWSNSEPATGQVEYGTTTAYGLTTTLEPTLLLAHNQTIPGLAAGTRYYFRIRSIDAAGNLSTATGWFDTLPSVPVAAVPGAPTGLTATPLAGAVSLAWVAPVSDGGSQITGYRVYRNGSSLQTLGVVLAWQNTGLTAGQPYSYEIAAINAIGEGPKSAPKSATPLAPPPGPPPPNRPWAAPVTPNVVNVSAGANLQSVVNAAPNGTVFNFPANTLFTVSTGIALNGRNNLVFNLNGSTIKSTGDKTLTPSSPFYLTGGSTHITISNGTLNGSNPYTGSDIYSPGASADANLMGVASYGTQYLELDRVRIRNTWGDFVYLSSGSQYVWVHDGDFDYCGRMGVAFIECSHVIIERNTLNHIGLIAFDIEPNDVGQVLNDIHIQDNTVGWWALSNYQTNWFFAYATTKGVGSNIYVERNVCTNGAVAASNNPSGISALSTHVEHTRVSNLVFRGNTTPFPGRAGIDGSHPTPLFFWHVDGLIVTGNTPPTSGSLSTVIDCPGSVTSPNP